MTYPGGGADVCCSRLAVTGHQDVLTSKLLHSRVMSSACDLQKLMERGIVRWEANEDTSQIGHPEFEEYENVSLVSDC